LERLTEAQGKPNQDLLNFLHAEAWESLSPTARRLMQALLLMPDGGGTLEQLAEATGTSTTEAASALRLLAQRSLINVKGDLTEKRYALHQLTRTFVERLVTQETS
jgi:DNA-binding MarR family transcriptional regulator